VQWISQWLDQIGNENRLALGNVEVLLGDWSSCDGFHGIGSATSLVVGREVSKAVESATRLLQCVGQGATFSITTAYPYSCLEPGRFIRLKDIKMPCDRLGSAAQIATRALERRRSHLRASPHIMHPVQYADKVLALDMMELGFRLLIEGLTGRDWMDRFSEILQI